MKSEESKVRRKKMQQRESQRKEDSSAPNVREVAKRWVSRKVGSLKRGARSHVVRGEIKNCTPLWREAHFEVKMLKNWGVRTTYWSWDVEKFARRCGEKHLLKKPKRTKHCMLGPLFEVAMWKNCTPLWREAHFEVKMYKTLHARTTFEVAMWKNCTPLWREAHLEVKIVKNWRSRSTFGSSDVEKLHAAVARSTFVSQNVQNTCVLPTFWSSDV